MNLKKLLTILCVLLVLLSFAGCGENTPTEPEQSQISTQPSGTETHQPTEGTLTPDTSATEATVPDVTRPTGTEGETTGTTSTEPTTQPTTEPSTEPTTGPTTEPTTEPVTTKPEKPQLVVEYETYIAMSGKEQEEFLMSYPGGIPAYFVWLNAAREAYENYYPDIEIDGSGSVDLGEVTGKNP